jgi:hypothetical protein
MKSNVLSRFNEDVSIVLCGEAGQWIQTVEHIMVYGLTKGQASPTSLQGFKTLVQRLMTLGSISQDSSMDGPILSLLGS